MNKISICGVAVISNLTVCHSDDVSSPCSDAVFINF